MTNPFILLSRDYDLYTTNHDMCKYDFHHNKRFESNFAYNRKFKKAVEYYTDDKFELRLLEYAHRIHLHDIKKEDIALWFTTIRDYIHFLTYAEKVYMYHNEIDEEKSFSIMSETEIEESLIVYCKESGYSVKISFEDSEIMQLSMDEEYDPLKNFIENGNSNRPITFTEITISRNFGHKYESNFRFVLGEPLVFNDSGDEILFNKIQEVIWCYL